jgi:hypothetical protein
MGCGSGVPSGALEQLHRLGQRLAFHLAQLRHGSQKRLRVGVLRLGEDLLDRAFLHLVAAVHDHNLVGDLRDHGHVVGDEHHRCARLALQPVDQRQDLGLDRNVERGRRFICYKNARLAGQRDGDDDPLAHAARQLVRILLQAPLRLGDAHLAHQFQRAFAGLGFRHALVLDQALGQLPFHGKNRVQRRHRLLEDHPDLVAANVAHQSAVGLGEVDRLVFLAVEHQLTARDLPPPNSTSRISESDDTDLPEPLHRRCRRSPRRPPRRRHPRHRRRCRPWSRTQREGSGPAQSAGLAYGHLPLLRYPHPDGRSTFWTVFVANWKT